MNKKKVVLIIVLFIIINSLYSTDNYYYKNLNDEEKILYNEIQTHLNKREDILDLNIFDFDKISNAFYSVINDNPQFFYVNNNLNYQTSLVNDNPVKAQVTFSYKEEFNSKKIDDINKELNYIKYSLYFKTINSTNFEKIKTCFDYLCNTSTYDKSETDQSLYSILIENKGVCASYAKSFKYLMDFFDIPNYLVEGKLINSDEAHIWNMVELNGSWYHVDVTQADSNNNYIDYSYFLTTDKQILKDHKIESTIIINKAIVEDSFYLDKIGCYFRDFNEKDLNTKIFEYINNNDSPLIITFKNKKDYIKSLNYLFYNNNLSQLILNLGYKINEIEYSLNDFTYTLIINFDKLVKDSDIIKIENYSKDFLENEIRNIVSKGNREIKLLFTNKTDFYKGKELLLENQFIFEIINDINSIEIVNYDNSFRFDILF